MGSNPTATAQGKGPDPHGPGSLSFPAPSRFRARWGASPRVRRSRLCRRCPVPDNLVVLHPVVLPEAMREAGAPLRLQLHVLTADEIYVRLHGPKRWYRHDYSKSELAIWADRIEASGAKRAWIYFNNDNDAHAPKNATALRRMLGRVLPVAVKRNAGTLTVSRSVLRCLGDRSMTSKSLWMDIDVAPGAKVLEGVHECDVASSVRALPGFQLRTSSANEANPSSSLTVAASAEA